MQDYNGAGSGWAVLVVVGDWPNFGKSSGSGESRGERLGKGRERLMRVEVREKINKIRIYTATVTMHICTVTVANVYICTIIEGLMWSKFKRYCVILHLFLFCTSLHPLM